MSSSWQHLRFASNGWVDENRFASNGRVDENRRGNVGACVQFGILGPLEVRADGIVVPIGGSRQRALLALLLCKANEVVSRERLSDELLGERPTQSADRMLRVQVSRLRKALKACDGDARLTARPPGYVLRVEPGELDLLEFERLVDGGRAALERGDPGLGARLFRDGEALWRGRPLADLEFEPFARVEVQRLEGLRLASQEERIEAELRLGRHSALCSELEALVSQHPLRERLRAQLMLALYRSGRQIEALDFYRDTRAHLMNELGLEPGRALQALEQAVLRQDESLELQASELQGPRVPIAMGEESGRLRGSADLALEAKEPLSDPAPPPNPLADWWARMHPRRRRRAAPIVAGIAVAVVALTAFIASGDHGRTVELVAAEVHANALVFADLEAHDLVGQQDVHGRPTALAAGAGAVWATDAADDAVLKLDPRTHRLEDRIAVGRAPGAIAATGDGIWVANTGSGTVSEISPASGTIVATVRVGNAPVALAADAAAVWVADAGDGTLRRIDPATASIVATIELAQPLSDIAIGPGAVWVTSALSGLLIRIDPGSNRPLQTIAVGNEPASVAVAAGAVWVANEPDDTISRVDDRTGVVRKLDVPDPGSLLAADGVLWVAQPQRAEIVEIDPRSRTMLHTISTGSPVGAMAAASRTLILATLASPQSHRGGTLRVAAGDGLDSIDPGEAYSALGWQLLSLTNDGLLTYARAAGPAGATIVPDLAASLPLVQDGGRTFTFRLRPGLRYSNGAPVRPEDVRFAIERQFRAGSGLAQIGVPILGGDRCSRDRCDLTRGVSVDNATRTITIRLAAPDPAFLYQLALPFGSVVAPGSASIGAGVGPLPATGPYVIRRYVPGREVVLGRNARFRQWAATAQPAGFPDRIVVRLGLAQGAQVRAVQNGTADVALDGAPPSALRRLGRTYPLQLHAAALPQIIAMFLNTRMAPFDRLSVRQAVAMAVDRSAIVRQLGGGGVARATCQILPQGFPGYQPFCPTTASPNAAGVWRAPAIERARRRILASGTAGMRVAVSTVESDAGKLARGRYFVHLLRRLGYRATLRLYPDYHAYYSAIALARSRTQIGVDDWYADYPSGSAFFATLFACASYKPATPTNANVAGFCDRSVNREIIAATKLELVNPVAANVAWVRVDREITRAAPWVPLASTIRTDFVARRVGNYLRNPVFGILLDQLWTA